MVSQRFVGLSKQQPVPRLLSVIGKAPVTNEMKDVPVDAPPLSSSSDDDGLPTRGEIRPSVFRQRLSPAHDANKARTDRHSTASAGRFKRTRAPTRLPERKLPGSSPKEPTDRQLEAIESDTGMSSPASKKSKRSPPGKDEQDSPFQRSIFLHKPVTRRYSSKPKVFISKPKPSAKPKRPPKEVTSDEDEDAQRYKLNIPDLPSSPGKGSASPARRFKAMPGSDLDSPAKPSPTRKKRLKMPYDGSPGFPADRDIAEESQRPVLRIPDELPASFLAGDGKRREFASSPLADPSNSPNLLRDSTSSPLTDLDSPEPDKDPVCPLCGKQVEKAHLDEYKRNNPRGRVANMRRFCEGHRRQSARETWVQRGYPDINWQRFDERIAQHYPYVSKLLEETGEVEESSHYRRLFGEMVRTGRNKSLLTSDVSLTPGYYGFRGLRAMTENLVTEFGPLLLKRAREDRLVSARGATMYLQMVVVPELAVRLIMEDMSVGEEEAREILAGSTEVGELLNDEIPDVVASSSDDDDEEDRSRD
ncbi:hypothetical protein N657DRAFT_639863 [Parathielavia appendiculata]|uniref:Restriction of telomere capping protein 4 n=1 Tax=Parathielavia appendiculata TaxID=2587402 RepID=A0AAN6Z981_9PEZI|nr:hypothetical protein N657DRAFT_639863 [Parathielavia appendiculata]